MSDFDNFWQHVPRKVGKISARKSYPRQIKILQRERPDDDPHEFLLAAIQQYAKSKRVADGYILNPATWLNAGHYYDEHEPATNNNGKAEKSFMDDVTKAEMKRAREIRQQLKRKRRTPVIMNFDLTKAFDPGWQPPGRWYFSLADPLREVPNSSLMDE